MRDITDNSTAKVFFALWPKESERKGLKAWQASLKKLCGGRVMRLESLHATLLFIGQVEQHRLETLRLAAQEVHGDAFDLSFDSARYWGHNHIAYAAPGEVPQQLEKLVGALEQSMRKHRFKFDRREYKPHVTLLRNAHWTDAPLPVMREVRWKVCDFALVQSMPQEYRVLARFPLQVSDG